MSALLIPLFTFAFAAIRHVFNVHFEVWIPYDKTEDYTYSCAKINVGFNLSCQTEKFYDFA